jgi:FSR family fosmidomycin resistance protein-like MFS transporter
MLAVFRNRLFFAVSSGHFMVDVLNSTGPVLMAVLAAPLGLSYGQIGLALTLYTFAGSLSQPLFGWLADRFQGRPALLAGLGTLWMALCLGAMALQQSWATILPLFLLAALGSGLFHPIGTSTAGVVNRARAGSATSLFFFCGQLGLALGPAIGGRLFDARGSLGMLPLCAAALLPASLLLTAPAPPALAGDSRPTARGAMRTAGWLVAAFVALVAVRSSIQASYTAFLPTLFAGRGWEPATYGALAGTFMLASAIGNVATGELADRFGMRPATVWPLLLGVPAGLLCLWATAPAAAFAACGLAGLLIGGQHSILVVHAQRLLPARQGFAAGLILGFTFAAGGIGTWVGGVAADRFGLLVVMQAITLLGVPAALLALTLPRRARLAPVGPASALAPPAKSASE